MVVALNEGELSMRTAGSKSSAQSATKRASLPDPSANRKADIGQAVKLDERLVVGIEKLDGIDKLLGNFHGLEHKEQEVVEHRREGSTLIQQQNRKKFGVHERVHMCMMLKFQYCL